MSEVLVHYQDYEELKRMMRESGRDYDTQLIEKAYNLASEAHGDQRRVSGVPYILHPTSVACILVDLGMDSETVVAALLHDVVEDTDVTLEEIIKLFGDEKVKSGMLYGNFDDTEGISYWATSREEVQKSLDEIGIPYMKDDEDEQE